MDSRGRDLERKWRATGDINIHSALLGHLLRIGLFDEKRLICAAYLGHPAAKLVVPEFVKPAGIVFDGFLMKNEDIRDYIYWLKKFGKKITHRAALGILRMAANNMLHNQLSKILEKTIVVVENNTEDSRKALRGVLNNLPNNFQLGGWNSRQSNLYRDGRRIAYAISQNNIAVNEMKSISIWFKDDKIKTAIKNEVYPFLLGEYK